MTKLSYLAGWILLACVAGSHLQAAHAAVQSETFGAVQNKLEAVEKMLAEGQNKEAAEVLETMSVLHPSTAEIFSLWAVALGRLGERVRALRIIDRGLRYSPKNRHLIRARGLLSSKEDLIKGYSPPEGRMPLDMPNEWAEEFRVNRQGDTTRRMGLSGALRSMLLPGWGQWKAGHKDRALIVGLPTVMLAGGGFLAGWAQRKAARAYSLATNAGEAERQFERAQNLRLTAAGLGGMAVALWLFGIADGGLVRVEPQGGLSLSLAF